MMGRREFLSEDGKGCCKKMERVLARRLNEFLRRNEEIAVTMRKGCI
jgi:hypothetical protein